MAAKQTLRNQLTQDDLPKVLQGLLFLAETYKTRAIRVQDDTFPSCSYIPFRLTTDCADLHRLAVQICVICGAT